MYIGCHMSIQKGFTGACEGAHKIGANTMQFFTRNPRGTKAKKLDERDVKGYIEKIKTYNFGPVVAHAPYTLNLASYKDDLWELAQNIIIDDLERMDKLGVPYLVLHPGSHLGKGTEYGIERIATALTNICHKSSANTMILLETMAGSGTEVGGSFEELATILQLVKGQTEIGICFDTCHTFSAGYDVDTELDAVLTQFDEAIGLNKLKAVHINDSKNEKGSRKDRHANIGEGLMGLDTFRSFMSNVRLKDKPFVLETPSGVEKYEQEIRILRNMNGEA